MTYKRLSLSDWELSFPRFGLVVFSFRAWVASDGCIYRHHDAIRYWPRRNK